VRSGGAVILAARCREGFAQQAFEERMRTMGTSQVLGGHKAAAIAGLLTEVDVYLVSELPDDVVRSMCMHPFASVDDAVAAALARYGEEARFLVAPHGSRVTARQRRL